MIFVRFLAKSWYPDPFSKNMNKKDVDVDVDRYKSRSHDQLKFGIKWLETQQ